MIQCNARTTYFDKMASILQTGVPKVDLVHVCATAQ